MTRLPPSAAPGRMARRNFVRRSRSSPGGLAVAIGAVALLGCIDPIDLDEFRTVGYIPPEVFAEGGGANLQIPETATAGVPLEIVIWTEHWCAEDAGTDVVESGGSAVAVPYIFAFLGRGCTLDNKDIEHRSEVVFQFPGPSELVLRYSRVGGGSWKPNGTKVFDVMVHPAG